MKKIAVVVAGALMASVVTLPAWKPIAKKRSKWFVVSTNVYQSILRRTGVKSGQIDDPYTSKRSESEIPTALARIDSTFENYRRHLGPADPLEGKSVLEIGPGNDVGVALRFAAAGASRVFVVDKFVPMQLSAFHQKLYRELRASLTPPERERFDTAIDLSEGIQPNPASFTYINQGIEDSHSMLAAASIDVVVSNAVLEEIYDIDRTFAEIDRALKPGGMQIHKIDLRDYGMFSNYGFHPLEFLTIPDGIYEFMSESVGSPNRRLVDYYRRKMQELGYSATIYTTWVLGGETELIPPREHISKGEDYTDATLEQVRSIRGRLLDRYRTLPDEDLIVQGILLVARKP